MHKSSFVDIIYGILGHCVHLQTIEVMLQNKLSVVKNSTVQSLRTSSNLANSPSAVAL